jgi:hypothetical protein
MFRVEILHFTNRPVLKLEGRLVGEWAEQARSIITEDLLSNGAIVDLTDVTYVDSVGEGVLSWLSSIGARFVANGIYASSLCERLHLLQPDPADPPKKKQRGSQHARHSPPCLPPR